MDWKTIRRTLAVVGFACSIAAAASIPARAGTMTFSYSFPGYSVEPQNFRWAAPLSGTMTVTVNAFRSTVAASHGFISGGTVSSVYVGAPSITHKYGGHTKWSGSVVFGPSLMGSFAGLNAAGTAFTAGGTFAFFNFTPPSAPTFGQALISNSNSVYGGRLTGGFFGVTGKGTAAGGTGLACFNENTGSGPCFTYPYFFAIGSSPSFGHSNVPAGTVPGFFAGGPMFPGSEVSRTIAVEPVPEPTTALLLGLGLLTFGAFARRTHR